MCNFSQRLFILNLSMGRRLVSDKIFGTQRTDPSWSERSLWALGQIAAKVRMGKTVRRVSWFLHGEPTQYHRTDALIVQSVR